MSDPKKNRLLSRSMIKFLGSFSHSHENKIENEMVGTHEIQVRFLNYTV